MANKRSIDQRNSGTHFWNAPHFGTRRMLFRHLAAGVGGYFLLPQGPMETIARAADHTREARAKQVIFIMLAGAPSQVDTFDLKEGPWTPRRFEPTTYGDDLRFPRGLFPNLAGQLSDVALLRSVRSWAVVHGLANQWIQIARNPVSSAAKIAPHIGSVIARELGLRAPSTLPSFFSLNATGGPGAGFLPVEDAPIYLQPAGDGLSPETYWMSRETYARRRNLLTRLEAAQQFEGAAAEAALLKSNSRDILFNDSVDSLFRFSSEESTRYGTSSFGNACIIARNLVRSDLGVRFVEITFPGWDNHAAIYQTLPALARDLDDGLGSLISDLRGSGKLEDTLIVAMGEFGRTVGAPNFLAGRDHYAQQSVFVAGAGVRGGRAIGKTDQRGSFTIEPGWSAERNIRPEDVAATIYSALGVDWTKVVHTDSGVRFEYVPIVDDLPYQPISELWGS
jgi:hypothetical protein